MDYYQVSVQCNMLSLPENDGGEWAKREDVERLEAERDELRRKLDKIADWARLAADGPDTTFAQAGSGLLSIVEGRDNG